MFLSCVTATNFRNLTKIGFDCSSNFNIFYGANGSGKTSILEAIYYLAMGRSFRTHLPRRIIQYGQESFALFGKVAYTNSLTSIGIVRSTTQGKQIKIAGEKSSSPIELIRLVPLQLLNQHSYHLLEGKPKVRRQFIDWGVFHVKPIFLELWRRVERIIEQRNAAIRTSSPANYIRAWDRELAQVGVALDKQRQEYLDLLIPTAKTIVATLLPNLPIEISYFSGWDNRSSLEQLLTDNLSHDIRLGYTTMGPHRAELKFTVNRVPIKDTLSRGQQKLFVYSLQLAQGILLYSLTKKNCIYLIDDLTAELDLQKCNHIISLLQKMETQLFLTTLQPDNLREIFTFASSTLFHVEQGTVSKTG